MKKVLKARHAFKSLAGDVQHRRRTGAASRLQVRAGKRDNKGGRGKVVQPWVGVNGTYMRAVSKWG